MAIVKKLLIVDDEAEICEQLGSFFKALGYDVITTVKGIEGREYATSTFFPVIILDLNMSDLHGEAILKEALKCYPESKVIIVTGTADDEVKARLLEMGVYDYFTKPINLTELVTKVKGIFQNGESV